MPRLAGCRSFALELVGHGRSIPEGVGGDIPVTRKGGYLIEWPHAVERPQALVRQMHWLDVGGTLSIADDLPRPVLTAAGSLASRPFP